jgi:CMP-N-acetylneuraminate monooxygenase
MLSNYGVATIKKNFTLNDDEAKYMVVDSIPIWVCKINGKIKVLHDECAHMGGNLSFSGKKLVCSSHGWTYHLDGTNINNLSPALKKVKIVSESDSEIQVLLPIKQNMTQKNEIKNSLKLSLHAHATIEISYRGETILFDPWLEGPAFFGSWHLYPKPQVKADEIKTNAIVITHPHPDHFHIPTLEKIDKKTPIYFPSFPSKIIEKTLDKLGFVNQIGLLWDDPLKITEFFVIKFLRPRSMWEDSAVLMQVIDDGTIFSWLNLVDAGSVIDELALPKIDLLSSAFDQGASGYPLTWTHLSDNRKVRILNSQKINTTKLLPDKALKIGASHFLPFAGHWRLGLPQHRKFAEMIPHTEFADLKISFKKIAPEIDFIGIYPGESYDFHTKYHHINPITRNELVAGFKPDPIEVKSVVNSNFESDIDHYMRLLQKKAEAFSVENIDFRISNSDNTYKENFRFASLESENNPVMIISVKVPNFILQLFSKGEANWDHIAIGYWGEWSREPDIYPANFMRLLQSGIESPNQIPKQDVPLDLSLFLQFPIADILEKNPDF